MKEAVYSFSNSAGDKFYLRLAADSDLFLSKELASFLKDMTVSANRYHYSA